MTTHALHAQGDAKEVVLFNEIVDLLIRQQEGTYVTPQLKQVLTSLERVYQSGKCNFAICQLGIGVANIGLGDHDEARSKLINAARIATGDPVVADNVAVSLLHIGDFRAAQQVARDGMARFPGNFSALAYMATVFVVLLDFSSLREALNGQLRLVTSSSDKEQIVAQIKTAERNAQYIADQGYTHAEVLDRMEFAVSTVRDNGNKVFWVQLRATAPDSVRLELYVDADHGSCAELNFKMASALYESFGDRVAENVVNISTRPFKALQNKSNVVAL